MGNQSNHNPHLLGGLAGLALVAFAVLLWQHGRALDPRHWRGSQAIFVAAPPCLTC